MKQAITFNTTMKALIPEKKILAPGCEKNIMIILLFLPQAKPETVNSMVSKQL